MKVFVCVAALLLVVGPAVAIDRKFFSLCTPALKVGKLIKYRRF